MKKIWELPGPSLTERARVTTKRFSGAFHISETAELFNRSSRTIQKVCNFSQSSLLLGYFAWNNDYYCSDQRVSQQWGERDKLHSAQLFVQFWVKILRHNSWPEFQSGTRCSAYRESTERQFGRLALWCCENWSSPGAKKEYQTNSQFPPILSVTIRSGREGIFL